MSHSIALVWFRQDLRLQDNPALYHACETYPHVLPIYIHELSEQQSWPMGAASQWWLHHSLAALDATLRQHHTQLIIRQGNSLAALQTLINQTGATAVYWNRCYEPASIERDTQIKAALQHQGITVKSFNAGVLHEPWTVKTQAAKPYQVFTPFWKACQKLEPPAAPLPQPPQLNCPSALPASEPLAALQLLPSINWAVGMAKVWQPGEAGAQTRLQNFCANHAVDYQNQRDFPAVEGVSKLSPHLHFGELSPRQVLHHTQQRIATEQWSNIESGYLRQLYWREFAYHLLYHFPTTPAQPLRPAFAQFPWQIEAEALLTAWQQGKTGFPIVDAGMRELWETGWMHNRVRMITASFLTKNCRIHWLEGAHWFWDTLVDADLANNTLGWQWVAGCGADAAPYYRIFNPLRQSEKFDPEGHYLRRWLPELAHLDKQQIHAPNLTQNRLNYPPPLVDYQASRQAALAAYEAIAKPSKEA